MISQVALISSCDKTQRSASPHSLGDSELSWAWNDVEMIGQRPANCSQPHGELMVDRSRAAACWLQQGSALLLKLKTKRGSSELETNHPPHRKIPLLTFISLHHSASAEALDHIVYLSNIFLGKNLPVKSMWMHFFFPQRRPDDGGPPQETLCACKVSLLPTYLLCTALSGSCEKSRKQRVILRSCGKVFSTLSGKMEPTLRLFIFQGVRVEKLQIHHPHNDCRLESDASLWDFKTEWDSSTSPRHGLFPSGFHGHLDICHC